MSWANVLRAFISVVVLVGLPVVGWLTYDEWSPWLLPAPAQAADEPKGEEHEHAHADRVKLSEQAKANLGLRVAALELTSTWKTMQVPGIVVERPGSSNRAVTTTVAGIVTKIFAIPGQSVKPGDALFTLRLVSEYLQNLQAQFYKTLRDLEINADEQKRLRDVADSATLFKSRLLELGYEERRLRAALDTYRQDLVARGLSAAQIEQITGGKFLTEVTVAVPGSTENAAAHHFDVEELKVQLGEPVQAGQVLAYLANHETLEIEGKAFEQEAAALLKAKSEGWPITATFLDQTTGDWPPLTEPLKIRFVSSHVDPATRLVSFFLPLVNQQKAADPKAGGPRQLWRFRPGQRVRLELPLDKMEGVFVLPRSAVVRDGSETYVFRANGEVFERKAIHVRWENQDKVVIANDGSVTEGNVLAQNAAAALNRALAAQNESGGGGHDHHGHDH